MKAIVFLIVLVLAMAVLLGALGARLFQSLQQEEKIKAQINTQAATIVSLQEENARLQEENKALATRLGQDGPSVTNLSCEIGISTPVALGINLLAIFGVAVTRGLVGFWRRRS